MENTPGSLPKSTEDITRKSKILKKGEKKGVGGGGVGGGAYHGTAPYKCHVKKFFIASGQYIICPDELLYCLDDM